MRDQNLKLIQIYKIKRVEHLRKLKDEIFLEFVAEKVATLFK